MAHVGEQIGQDGANVGDPRYDRLLAQVVQDNHGRYAESAYRGRLFLAANQAAQTFGVGLSATVATLSLTNPAGSGRILSLVTFTFAFSAAPAAAAALVHAAFIPGVTTAVVHTTPEVVRPALLGGYSIGPVGLADRVATLPAVPVIVRPLYGVTGAAALTPGYVKDEIAGEIQLFPGSVWVIQANAAAAGFSAISWEELPL